MGLSLGPNRHVEAQLKYEAANMGILNAWGKVLLLV